MSPRWRSAVSVVSVLALSGLLFSASAQLASSSQGRHPEDLASLVSTESARAEQLAETAAALSDEVERLGEAVGVELPARQDDLRRNEAVLAGSWPVTGRGVSVTVTDAPASSLDIPGVRPDDLVVHQQDLEHIINALWAGGAEAMTLQGERVTSMSAFRCAGNILLLHGNIYSPPYTVEAIGDPDLLQASLDSSPGVALYQDYVEWVGLGYGVDRHEEIAMPAFTAGTELRHAAVPEGTDVFS